MTLSEINDNISNDGANKIARNFQCHRIQLSVIKLSFLMPGIKEGNREAGCTRTALTGL